MTPRSTTDDAVYRATESATYEATNAAQWRARAWGVSDVVDGTVFGALPGVDVAVATLFARAWCAARPGVPGE